MIQNLPREITEPQLTQELAQFGPVLGVSISADGPAIVFMPRGSPNISKAVDFLTRVYRPTHDISVDEDST